MYIIFRYMCISIFFRHKQVFFSLSKRENWFVAIANIAVLKRQIKLLAGNINYHVIDIFTSEDMEISYCVFSVSYCPLYNKVESLLSLPGTKYNSGKHIGYIYLAKTLP